MNKDSNLPPLRGKVDEGRKGGVAASLLTRYSTLMDELDARRRKALFRAQRRGFRELDLVFGAFADTHLPRLDEGQLDRFEALLKVPDWQMYAWIVGQETVPENHNTDVFALLCAYRPHSE